MDKPRINVYTCKAGHQTVTIDRDKGVTPMMLSCKHAGCAENAVSSGYNVPDGLTPQYEWYLPTDEQLEMELLQLTMRFPDDGSGRYKQWLAASRSGYIDHRDRGGLFIRKIAS
jgi:hypothetical protein